ncbi:dihydrofolate reductase family protein [Indiicoccus explosivorum]|uniref:dihydrofolate reductase family protein n=1 Tax=Indiicoccus explosivorum TaxID=1917864 RepID=UPI000B450094|nr:dihydrofolate reductase family protein [Indiicoccus explosivorum]
MSNQRKAVFYGAVTVDGYLARDNHSLDWLIGTEGEEESTYPEFIRTVDTEIMGRETYDQVLILSPDGIPDDGRKRYVFSRTRTGQDRPVEFVNDDIAEFVRRLKSEPGKDIWIVGGGQILRPLLEAQLVDEFIIQLAPALIGRGIPLFPPGDYDSRLELTGIGRFGQFAEVRYTVKRTGSAVNPGHS